MKHDRDALSSTSERGISSVKVLFGRLMWFIIGPMILLFTTYGIIIGKDGWLTGKNATFVVTVALMVWGRWIEQRSGSATLADGKPATWEHFHRYVRYLLPGAAVVWLITNVTANHLLS